MKRATAILIALLVSGCTHVPIKQQFPEIPPSLQAKCPQLQLVPEDTQKLSEVLKVVTSNYGQYHECSIRVDTWLQWYKEQREIFNSVK